MNTPTATAPGGRVVKAMGMRPRPGQSDAQRQERAEPRRVKVTQAKREGATRREYAPKIFDGSPRGGEVDAELSDIRDVVSSNDTVVAADTAGQGPIIMESDHLLTRGGTVRQQQGKPRVSGANGGARRRGPERAKWQGGDVQQQDQVILGSQQAVQEGTVASNQLIQRQEPGTQDPTGEPCSCVFEWEVNDKDEIEVYQKPDMGMATSLRGAPAWMTWCVVCGGERDGQFRPENAIRYGTAIPEAPAQLNVENLKGEIVGAVMEEVVGYLGSKAFLSNLAKAVKASK